MEPTMIEEALNPTVTMRLARDVTVNGKVRLAKGSVVAARMTHRDSWGIEARIWDVQKPDLFAIVGPGDIEGAEMVG